MFIFHVRRRVWAWADPINKNVSLVFQRAKFESARGTHPADSRRQAGPPGQRGRTLARRRQGLLLSGRDRHESHFSFQQGRHRLRTAARSQRRPRNGTR